MAKVRCLRKKLGLGEGRYYVWNEILASKIDMEEFFLETPLPPSDPSYLKDTDNSLESIVVKDSEGELVNKVLDVLPKMAKKHFKDGCPKALHVNRKGGFYHKKCGVSQDIVDKAYAIYNSPSFVKE